MLLSFNVLNKLQLDQGWSSLALCISLSLSNFTPFIPPKVVSVLSAVKTCKEAP